MRQGLRNAAELPSHLAEGSVHVDRPPQPGQVLHRYPLHAHRQVSHRVANAGFEPIALFSGATASFVAMPGIT